MSTVTQEKDYGHVPVLLHECLDALAIKPDGIDELSLISASYGWLFPLLPEVR